MANNVAPLPDALKNLKPYLTLATQLEQRNDKNIAYYCRLFAVQHGMSINKTLPECKKFLFNLMDNLEATKNQNKNDESIQNQLVGQTVVEQYALKIFDKADEDDREAKFTKNLVKAFYSAGLLFDVLNYFGDLSEDLVVKKQYAKRKAMYLNKCFQTGESPIPGPLIEDNLNDLNLNAGGDEFNANQPHKDNRASFNENRHTDAYQAPAARPSSSSTKPESTNLDYYGNEQTESSFPPELLAKAQKLCKYASSALQYEDITTAITNLEQCLQVLKTGK